jgi:hypothetical protein
MQTLLRQSVDLFCFGFKGMEEMFPGLIASLLAARVKCKTMKAS